MCPGPKQYSRTWPSTVQRNLGEAPAQSCSLPQTVEQPHLAHPCLPASFWGALVPRESAGLRRPEQWPLSRSRGQQACGENTARSLPAAAPYLSRALSVPPGPSRAPLPEGGPKRPPEWPALAMPTTVTSWSGPGSGSRSSSR